MDRYKIAVYAGDGIGIEVTREAVKALKACQELFNSFTLDFTEFDWGSRYWKQTGKITPEGYLGTLADFDCILLGAVGDPANIPDRIAVPPLIEMRQTFEPSSNHLVSF